MLDAHLLILLKKAEVELPGVCVTAATAYRF